MSGPSPEDADPRFERGPVRVIFGERRGSYPDGNSLLVTGERETLLIDPALGLTIDTIAVGDGPSGMAFLENEALGIRRLYVANFHGQSVGVIELDPGSAAYHTQLAEVRC